MKYYFSLIALCLMSWGTANAADLGLAASNMHDITAMIGSIVEVIMYVAGVAVFVSACLKYRIHRQNPQQVHISTPITELVLAIVLILIPFVTRYGNDFVFEKSPAQVMAPARPAAK